MPAILKNAHGRMAFKFGRESAMRSTSELIDQLQNQNTQLRTELAAERAQSVQLQREAIQARLEAAILKRDAALDAALRDTPSPSQMVH